MTEGKEALGESIVKISNNNKLFIGKGLSTDIIEASAKAFIDAINKMVAVQKKD